MDVQGLRSKSPARELYREPSMAPSEPLKASGLQQPQGLSALCGAAVQSLPLGLEKLFFEWISNGFPMDFISKWLPFDAVWGRFEVDLTA